MLDLTVLSKRFEPLQEDIVFASFRNGFLETPFLVSIDRSTSSVVVAIRGTLSIADVITDLVNKYPPQGTNALAYYEKPYFLRP
jgi:hypothetical protein